MNTTTATRPQRPFAAPAAARAMVALLQRPVMQAARTASDLSLDAADIQHILGHAIASASLCVMETGCVPPSREQVLQRLSAGRPHFKSLA